MEQILRSVRQAELTQHRDFEPPFIGEGHEVQFEWGIRPLNTGDGGHADGHPVIQVTGAPQLFPGPVDDEWAVPDGFPDDSEMGTAVVKAQVKDLGVEALAWYRSFHFEPQGQWGIYLLDRGVYYLAKEHFAKAFPLPHDDSVVQTCIQQAVELLYQHELFHFITDVAATTLELNASPDPTGLYIDYSDNRFKNGVAELGVPGFLEEAMANEHARWRIFFRNKNDEQKDIILDFMDRQPDGYRHHRGVKHHRSWREGLNHLANHILGRSRGQESPFADSAFSFPGSFDPERSVPVYIVDTIPDDIYRLRAFDMPVMPTFSNHFEKDLKKAPDNIRDDFWKSYDYIRVNQKVNPSRNKQKLKGKKGFWKYRIKNWRAVMNKPRNEYSLLDMRKKIYKRIKHLK
jgi:mRNA-degrading endonuclease RelE of RelBE toxin-antitoxin system